MIEPGQKRFLRDGTPVLVGYTIWKHDPYWARLRSHMPFVQLMLPNGQIILRRTPTVESYLLEDRIRRQHG